ncbi:MAG: CBS domain-containing protein [Candidatus Dadabacteria bacterium]|nr:MAG: CBS domain-containing protein [Candidatus Dadabacteria bacterium]
MIVKDVMTRNPVYVTVETPIREVMRKLYEKDIRHLPVLEDDDLVGIVSDRDIRAYTWPLMMEEEAGETYKSPELDGPVSTVMRSDVISVQPDSEIVEVIDMMVENKVGAVPVVDAAEGRLIGIVSYVDILREGREFFV